MLRVNILFQFLIIAQRPYHEETEHTMFSNYNPSIYYVPSVSDRVHFLGNIYIGIN